MVTVSRTKFIDAPVEAVWAVLGDFGSISRWAPNVDHSSLMTEQCEGIGVVRRVLTGGTALLETTERWEDRAEISYRVSGLPSVMKSVTNTWRLGGSGDQTVVVLTTEIDAGSRHYQQLLAKALGGSLGKTSDQMLAGLVDAMASRSVDDTAMKERSDA